MNSENSLQLSSQTTRLGQLTSIMSACTIPSPKIATRKISKTLSEKSTASDKAAKNIKRNSTRKGSKVLNTSQIMKDTLMSEIEGQNVHVEAIPQEVLQKICEQSTNFVSNNKENISTENFANNQYISQNQSENVQLYQKNSSNLNRFSTYSEPVKHSADESQNCSFEENRFLYRTPCQTNSKHSRRHSQDNDFSDRDTVEESVSCFSEHHIGSQTKSEFDHDFTTVFSSNNTTPVKKQGSQDFIGLTDSKTEKERSIEEELANFNPEINPCAFDSETINYLIKREEDYAPEPHYLEKRQNEINWSMRAILFDWMMEVSMEFCLKRETYYYAVNYLDRYLSTVINIPKSDLQLVGVTALYMAAKVEEIYSPRVASFAKSTDNAYNEQQILEMELKMAKALKWMLTPPTVSTWANWYMNQWDLYIERSQYAQGHPLVMANGDDLIQFKQSNQKSYVRFREMMQIIDCITLDAKTLQYKPRALIASIMYVLLGKYFKNFTAQQIFEEFPRNSRYLLDSDCAFNELFGNFLIYSFGFELTDLLPTIQYIATYIRLPISLELPKAVKMSKENILEGHFEEFLAFQTHHFYNLQYIRRRPRNNF